MSKTVAQAMLENLQRFEDEKVSEPLLQNMINEMLVLLGYDRQTKMPDHLMRALEGAKSAGEHFSHPDLMPGGNVCVECVPDRGHNTETTSLREERGLAPKPIVPVSEVTIGKIRKHETVELPDVILIPADDIWVNERDGVQFSVEAIEQRVKQFETEYLAEREAHPEATSTHSRLIAVRCAVVEELAMLAECSRLGIIEVRQLQLGGGFVPEEMSIAGTHERLAKVEAWIQDMEASASKVMLEAIPDHVKKEGSDGDDKG